MRKTTLKKIDDLMNGVFTVKGIKVVAGTVYTDEEVEVGLFNDYMTKRLKSKYLYAVAICVEGNFQFGMSMSDELRKIASKEDMIEFFKSVIELFTKFPISELGLLDRRLKDTVTGFLTSRNWLASDLA
jgi:hypothetical protein